MFKFILTIFLMIYLFLYKKILEKYLTPNIIKYYSKMYLGFQCIECDNYFLNPYFCCICNKPICKYDFDLSVKSSLGRICDYCYLR